MAEEHNSGRRSRRDTYGEQPTKKRRSFLGCLGWIILLLVLIGGGIAAFSYYKLHSTAEAIYQPADANGATPVDKVRETEVSISDKEPVSILLLGMDAGAGRTTGEQNTDVMILVTIAPESGTAKMVSIPRDTYIASLDAKINSAYGTAGGASGSINAVQELLNVPIDYYALVNMTGMMNIIDAVGGVTVNNEFAFSQNGYDFAQGSINLATGEEALAYVRMRYEDPNGDFGRAARQRQVLIAILDKYQNVENVGSLLGLFETVQSNVTTDLTIDDMTKLALNYRVDSANIESTTLVGTGDTSTGTYYNILSDDQIAETSSMLRSHLGLE